MQRRLLAFQHSVSQTSSSAPGCKLNNGAHAAARQRLVALLLERRMGLVLLAVAALPWCVA